MMMITAIHLIPIVSTVAIDQQHFSRYSCAASSALSTTVFTPVNDRLLCFSRCSSTDKVLDQSRDQCVGVAILTDGHSSVRCGVLGQGDLPQQAIPCGDQGASVTIYSIVDVDAHVTSVTSCQCLYDLDLNTTSFHTAKDVCHGVGGQLPEADSVNTLAVSRR